MKKLFILSLFVLIIVSCNSTQSGFTIKFEIPGYEGNWLKLNKFVENEFIVADSLQVDSLGENILSGKVDRVELMYLTIEGERRSVRLFVENEEYTISGTIKDPAVESSSTVQKEMKKYEAGIKSYTDQMSALYESYRSARKEENEKKIDSLIILLEEPDENLTDYDSIYIMEHPVSYVSVLALRNIFYKYDSDGLETMIGMIDESVHSLEEYKYMADKLESMKKVAVGEHYTDFGLETPDGEILKISDVHNNNVLMIDLWAAWCGPCRKANPDLVAIYNQYHDQGFDILGVSLDRDRESWLKAIETDGLIWHQISDLKFWNSAGAQLYGVSSIPHALLIDKNGIIRAKNLRGDELKSRIVELLAE